MPPRHACIYPRHRCHATSHISNSVQPLHISPCRCSMRGQCVRAQHRITTVHATRIKSQVHWRGRCRCVTRPLNKSNQAASGARWAKLLQCANEYRLGIMANADVWRFGDFLQHVHTWVMALSRAFKPCPGSRAFRRSRIVGE